MDIDWAYLQRDWDLAGYMLEAVVMAIVVAVLMRVLMTWRDCGLAGLAFSAGQFHGREKRDYETSVQMPPPHIDGYYVWNWSWDQTTDFRPTALLCVGLMLLWLRQWSKKRLA